MKMTKLAILDIDGTLFDGNLGVELLKAQIKFGLFDQIIGEKIVLAYRKYKENLLSHDELINIAYEQYARGIKGQKYSAVAKLAQELWEKERQSIFPFTKKLISLLKDNQYMVIALSGSPVEMVEKLASHLGISNVWSATFEVVDNVYTGKLLFPFKRKSEICERVCTRKTNRLEKLLHNRRCRKRCLCIGNGRKSRHIRTLRRITSNRKNPSLANR